MVISYKITNDCTDAISYTPLSQLGVTRSKALSIEMPAVTLLD